MSDAETGEAEPSLPEELQEKDIKILQTGRWWIVELTEPGLAVQGESRAEALDKLAARLTEYEDRRDRDNWAEQFSAHETADVYEDRREQVPESVQRYLDRADDGAE